MSRSDPSRPLPGPRARLFPPRSARRGGFAIAVVLFMLAMVSLLMMTGYDLIRLVGEVRGSSRDALLAEQAAHAALDRFAGERIGPPPDSQVVNLTENTVVHIRARRLARQAGHRSGYLLVGEVEHGARFPAKRTVRTFAVLEPPVEPAAALSLVSGELTVHQNANVSGLDAASSGACAATPGNVAGALAVGSVTTTGGSPVRGSPATRTVASRQGALDLLGARWEYLLGADLPVQVSSTANWPSFGSLHPDSFPLIRLQGDFTPTAAHSGRGALIVTGTFRPGSAFSWNGVILAGAFAPNTAAPAFVLRGLMVAGLDDMAGSVVIPQSVDIQYNRCHVMRAFAKMSHLEQVVGTAWTER